jgi:exopolysaccharide biosynthesis polyprenyl glycosylphosphotransferase
MSAVEPSLRRPSFHAALAADEAGPPVSGERWLVVLMVGTLLVDLLLVLGAFVLAYWVRFIVADDEASALGMHEYVRTGVLISILTVLLLGLHGVYDEHRRFSWSGRMQIVVSGISTALVLTMSIAYILGDERFSRLWFAAGWAFAVVGLLMWRTVAQQLVGRARARVAPANRVVIVGANLLGCQVARELAERFEVLGYVDNGSDLYGRTDLPLLGPIAELPRVVHDHLVDELVITLPHDRREQLAAVIDRGFRRRVKVKLLPGLVDILPQTFDVHQVGGRPYLGFEPVARVSWVKRASDLVLAGAGLLAIWPLLAAIAIAVKLNSPGPVLYRQQRVGKDGRLFSMLKFRSMYQDAEARRAELVAANEASGPLFKIRDDPRVTRVGRILRRSSLDELPQLLNVLRGEMSLVGPRPPLPSEVEQYEDWQLGRLRATPGMTGLWQVSGRSEVSFHDMVRLDLHYIRNWSLSLDLEILWQTFPAVLGNRGAY